MADKERQTSRRSATPDDYSTFASSSPPGGDYKLTVDLVGTIQHELGKLTEAVNSLKEQTKEQGKKLNDIALDVHGAKVAGKALLWVVGVVGAILGIILAAYFRQILGVPSQ